MTPQQGRWWKDFCSVAKDVAKPSMLLDRTTREETPLLTFGVRWDYWKNVPCDGAFGDRFRGVAVVLLAGWCVALRSTLSELLILRSAVQCR